MGKQFSLMVVVLLVVGFMSAGVANAAKPYAGIKLNVLMEHIRATDAIKNLLPEFEKKSGIKVDIEDVHYPLMHEKLIPQLIAPEGSGSYSFLEIDSYWVGEFVSGNWLLPLGDRVASTPSVSLDNYIPSVVDVVGIVDGVTYMVPVYPYGLGLGYRKDIVESSVFQNAYKQKFGRPWRLPQSVREFVKVLEVAQEVTPPNVYGISMEGARIDPIVMEWVNYLFSMGGAIYDRTTWEPVINSEEGIKALELYVHIMKNFGQPGAAGASVEDMCSVFAQGQAVFVVIHNHVFPWVMDPTMSRVAEKTGYALFPGGVSQLGGFGWGIPKSSPNPDAAWEFLSWVESKEIAYKRAMQGSAVAQEWIYHDPEFLKKYPWQETTGKIIAQAKPFPIISRSTQMIEVIGENLSAAAIGELTPEQALNKAAKGLAEIAKEDPMIQRRLAAR